MTLVGYLALYCLLIIAVSLLGGWVPLHVRLTHKRIQIANSLIGGFMLGVALLHMLPHALMGQADHMVLATWMIGGVLTMFLLERFLHFHQHDLPSHPPTAHKHPHQHTHDHAHDHGHTHGPACEHDPAPKPIEDCDIQSTQTPHYEKKPRLSWSGAAVGLVLHCLIGGIALGAAMTADANTAWPGFALFLAIILHKPFDSMTLLALVTTSGWSRKTGHLINVLFSLTVPLGAGLFLLGFADEHAGHTVLVSNALAFAAGVFLCIALSDVLPELHFHQHDKIKLTAALLLGLALAAMIAHLESRHHDHGDSPTGVAHDHDGDGVADH